MATAASGQSPQPSVTAFRASSPLLSRRPSKAQKIATEQSAADSAGRALGLGTGERLVVKDVITDADGSTHVRYNRTFDGLRVIGGDLVSHRDKSGRAKGVSWNDSNKGSNKGAKGSHGVDVASTKPKLSASSARAAGTRKASLVQKTTAATKAELVVYSGGAPARLTPKLAYDVLTEGVLADQTPSRLHTIVDANTGATLTSFDEIQSGTGHGIHVGTVDMGTTAGPVWSMRDTVGNYATDLNGAVDLPGSVPGGTIFTDADNDWGDGTVNDRASAGVDAHYGAAKTFEYFKVVQGRNGILDNGVGSRSRVHYGNGYVNAFWDGSQMTYGDGAGNANPLTELDVTGHEMTHGVTENTAGLVGDGEAGGLNEATSDIFGTSIEWYAANPADVPDYTIGELVDVNGNGTPLRYMDRPSRDGSSPDCWSSTLGGLDSHYSAGPLNHWFYLASEGSGAKVINNVSYDSPTCNASTLAPIGRAAAAKIWYRTLTTYLTSSNTYAAAREGAIQSAMDLYGAASPECVGIEASFSAIGVPPGAQTCNTTAPPPPGSNLLRNPGFESGDSLWSGPPGVIGTWVTKEPARTGTWSAWLGGYGFFHDGSISQLVTIPAASSATLSYYVHIDTDERLGDPAYDTMTVRAGATKLQTLSNVDAAGGYQLKTVSLSAYAGKTIALSFSGSEDGIAQTSFVLDDLSVTATDPIAPTVVITGKPLALTNSAAASFSFTGADGSDASGSLRFFCSLDGAAASACTSPKAYAGLSSAAHTFTVRVVDPAGNARTAAYSWRVDRVAPTVAMTAPATLSALTTSLAPAWSGKDVGGGLANVSVRWARAAYNGGFTAPVYPSTWQKTTLTKATLSGVAPGYTYCFAAQARDKAGNLSPWSASKCSAIALDDRSLTASAGWSRTTSSLYYRGTATVTSRSAVTLTRTGVQAKAIYLVATRCPTCSSVGVYWNGALIKNVNLYASTTIRRSVVAITTFTSVRSGTLLIRSLTSNKTVQIDGVALARY
jgi:Zn-dependent metalloprotease